MREQRFQLWTIDGKDAFLQLPQKSKVYVNPPRGYEHLLEEDEVWVLEKLLPGQRAGTREWGLFLKDTLEEEQYESLALSQNLFAKRSAWGQVEGVVLVHVDDIQLAATPEEVRIWWVGIYHQDGREVHLQVGGIAQPGEEETKNNSRGNWLRGGLTGIGRWTKATVCDSRWGVTWHECWWPRRTALYTCTGKSTDMPYSSGLPDTERLVLYYLKGTSGYATHVPRAGRSVLDPRDKDRQSTGEDLPEVFAGSDRGTRKSVSVAANFCLTGVLLHTLTRSQNKSIALSSCEAEYVAMTTGASEGAFLKNCVEFITGRKCKLELRRDSSSARAFSATGKVLACWQSTPHLMWITVGARTCSEGWSRGKASWLVEKHRRPQHKNPRKEKNQSVVELDGLCGYPQWLLSSWRTRETGGWTKGVGQESSEEDPASKCQRNLQGISDPAGASAAWRRISSRTIRAWANGLGTSVRRTNHSVTFDANATDVDDCNMYHHFWHYLQDGPTSDYGEPKVRWNKDSRTWMHISTNWKQQPEKLPQEPKEASVCCCKVQPRHQWRRATCEEMSRHCLKPSEAWGGATQAVKTKAQ